MYRYLDAIFSHKLTVLAPVVIATVLGVVGGISLTKNYQVQATIWVENSPLPSMVETRIQEQPSEVEARVFLEWLGTRTFMKELVTKAGLQEAIAQGTWPKESWWERNLGPLPGIGPLLKDTLFRRSNDPEVLLEQTMQGVRKAFRVEAVGGHVVRVTYAGDDPDVAAKLVSGAIELFDARTTASKATQAEVTVEFYQEQVRQHEVRLAAASQALQRFKEAHPAPANGIRPGAEDQQLTDLEKQYAIERTLYDAALSNLDRAQLTGAAELDKGESAFIVADMPEVPRTASVMKRELILFGLGGLLVGLIIGLGTVLAMAWLDPTVRSGHDLVGVTNLPVLMTIPHLVVPPDQIVGRKKEHAVRRFLSTLLVDN